MRKKSRIRLDRLQPNTGIAEELNKTQVWTKHMNTVESGLQYVHRMSRDRVPRMLKKKTTDKQAEDTRGDQ